MGKGRVRVKGAKGKRWRKGQSGLSNPSDVSHRQAARGKFGDHLSRDKRASAPLTAEALARLHTTQEELDRSARLGCKPLTIPSPFTVFRDGDVDLEISSSAGTTSAASSSALTLIETSHPVFGTVRKLWNSPTESHRVVGPSQPHISHIQSLSPADLCSVGSRVGCCEVSGGQEHRD